MPSDDSGSLSASDRPGHPDLTGAAHEYDCEISTDTRTDDTGMPLLSFKPKERWVFAIDDRFDRFRKMDDSCAKFMQTPLMWSALIGKVLKYLALLVTLLTTVEAGVGVPCIMHLLGFDDFGALFTLLMLLLSIASQIPKRFLWRARPYMVRRAKQVRRDVSSSFPSRAVTCAVVYGMCLGQALPWDLKEERTLAAFGFAVSFPFVAACARMFLGVHFITDCIGGFLNGVLVATVGQLLFWAEAEVCGVCGDDVYMRGPSCYAADAAHMLNLDSLENVNYVIVSVVLGLSALLVLLCLLKPLEFWKKSAQVFAMLFPLIAFRLTFACAPVHGFALPAPSRDFRWESFLVALALSAACTAVGKVTNLLYKKGRVILCMMCYLIVYAMCYATIAWWRLAEDTALIP